MDGKHDYLELGRLKESLSYDPETGVFNWRILTSNRAKIGARAGTNSNGYFIISVDGTRYMAHRLAWLYVTGEWPRGEIDHINGDRSDNRFENLRRTTHADNMKNMSKHKDNTSGFKGVFWAQHARRWRSYICANGRSKHLGYFNTPEEAYAAYCVAAANLHGEYARLD